MSVTALPRRRDAVVGDIRAFLVSAENLPSPRGAALQLIQLARDPKVGVNETVRVVKADPALAGFVLHAANAARFAAMPKAVDLQRAVVRLGMNVIRMHALALSVMKQRPPLRCKAFDYDRFWTASLLTGVLMDGLTRSCGGVAAEEAFSLGLLGSIGKLVLATVAPEPYAAVLDEARATNGASAPIEQRTFGFDHHELSAVLLADWDLPTRLADIVYWQRDPEEGGFTADSPSYVLAGALQLAAGLAELTLSSAVSAEQASALYLRAAILELSPGAVAEVAGEALADLRQWSGLIGVQPPATVSLPDAWPT